MEPPTGLSLQRTAMHFLAAIRDAPHGLGPASHLDDDARNRVGRESERGAAVGALVGTVTQPHGRPPRRSHAEVAGTRSEPGQRSCPDTVEPSKGKFRM